MLSQVKINGQQPRAEAVIELSAAPGSLKDSTLYLLDDLLDSAGWPGDITGPRGLASRLAGYMKQRDPGMTDIVIRMLDDIEESRRGIAQIRRALKANMGDQT